MTNTEYDQLRERKEILQTRIFNLKDVSGTHLQVQSITDVIDESCKELEKIETALTTKREYLYNFIGGGWNSEWAYTSNQAYAQAMERWGDDTKLKPDPQSFRVSTDSDYKSCLSLFY